MSVYQYGKMTVTGDAEILKDFVRYLEEDYDDEFIREGIKRGHTRDGEIEQSYLDDNTFCVEGDDNHFFIDIEPFSRIFPALKFDYINECHDGAFSSSYTVCLNGKTFYCEIGDGFTFDKYSEDEEKCRLCNTLLEENNELCGECSEFMDVLDE